MTAQATRTGFQRKPQYGPKRIFSEASGYPLYCHGPAFVFYEIYRIYILPEQEQQLDLRS